MKFKVFTLIAILLACTASVAVPDGSLVIDTTGGYRIAGYHSVGPVLIEALADGDAQIYFVSSQGAPPTAITARRVFPGSSYGDAYHPLRENVPRPFECRGDRIDSVYVTLEGATTEVILTWTNAH